MKNVKVLITGHGMSGISGILRMSMVNTYSRAVQQAATRHCLEKNGLYYGKEGAIRFAREYGVGLLDFSEKEAKEELKNSYSTVCVKSYNLKPPIDAKEWISVIEKVWEEKHTFMTTNGVVTRALNARWN